MNFMASRELPVSSITTSAGGAGAGGAVAAAPFSGFGGGGGARAASASAAMVSALRAYSLFTPNGSGVLPSKPSKKTSSSAEPSSGDSQCSESFIAESVSFVPTLLERSMPLNAVTSAARENTARVARVLGMTPS